MPCLIGGETLRRQQAPQPWHPPPAARVAGPRHDDLVQMAAVLGRAPAVQRLNAAAVVLQRAPNRTGLPDRLKQGVETLSGMSMDHVRVHYNSSKPAQLKAHAYAQGSEIHLAPGQERHLPHEAWHVVQQAQGRVRATMQMKRGIGVNSDAGLEHEATVMGAKALGTAPAFGQAPLLQRAPVEGKTVQLFPPQNIDEAEEELEQVESELFGKKIVLQWYYGGGRSAPLDGFTKKTLADSLAYDGLTADPGSSGLTPKEVIEKVKLLVDLRKWITKDQAQHRGFGYGNVPSIGFPRPSPLQQTYGLNPYAPELHGMPIGSAPKGSTYEQLGSFDMIRQKPPELLDKQRNKSKAYRIPPKKVDTWTEPPFESDIYSGESTMLNPKRMTTWKQEKRGETANLGPFKGKKWPDQQSQLGKSSAQESVASFNENSSTKLNPRIPYEWLHLFAFSMGGQDSRNPQDPRNFVVGTQYANYYHLIWEKAAKTLAAKHNVLVQADAIDVVSAEWRIYRTIRYTITLMETHLGTFDRPQSFHAPRRVVTDNIPCLEKPQVHAGDPDTLVHIILLELGVVTEDYEKAVGSMFDSHKPGHEEQLSPMEGGFSNEMDEEDDEDFKTALIRSVQEHAEMHGVLEHFEVGHADGTDNNCSILSAFDAAGAPITPEAAQRYREGLYYRGLVPMVGPLDLTDGRIANAILQLVAQEVGDRQMVIIRPHGGNYALTPVAGDGENMIFLYYSNGHFSPARLRG